MANAELIYNPYLLETSVRFNGQEPRINSQIEKYEGRTLKDWVEQIPQLFYDEMNGFDFDFNFTGTKADFTTVKDAFASAGISQEMVRLFHKNELEGVDIKCREIKSLIDWIMENPNRRLDTDLFFSVNQDLLSCQYQYVVIHGGTLGPINPKISVETIDMACELENTVLTNTPILLCIDATNEKQFRRDIEYLLKRKDVHQNQLFFMIHPYLNMKQISRVIVDLGVSCPQVIAQYDDEIVMEYLRNYPITEYIRNMIVLLEKTVGEISGTLEAENEASLKTNEVIHASIDRIESKISKLKQIDLLFTDHDNVRGSSAFQALQQELLAQINKWRNRKVKVVGDTEIGIAAEEFNAEISRSLRIYADNMLHQYEQEVAEIKQLCRAEYLRAEMDLQYQPDAAAVAEAASYTAPQFADVFLSMRNITYEAPKADFMEFLWRSSDKGEKEKVRVVTSYYEQWREKAVQLVLPLAENISGYYTQALSQYCEDITTAYHTHLQKLIREQTREKENLSAQLSEDEQMLQDDNNWLLAVSDQLTRIERG